ncbi:MAG: hypothetical protein IJV16_09460 [Lachnospiraceae bacterium]|nr:hypothetical protein [Lachnospiraceae bacterium]
MPDVLTIILVDMKLVEAACAIAIVGWDITGSRVKLNIAVLRPVVSALIGIFVAVYMQAVGCIDHCHGSAVIAPDM